MIVVESLLIKKTQAGVLFRLASFIGATIVGVDRYFAYQLLLL